MLADPEYVRGLFESEAVLSKQYMDRFYTEGDLCLEARESCVNWIVEFGNRHQLCDETVYAGMTYYDTFIGKVPDFGQTASEFYRLCLTCILLAVKFREARQLEEIRWPHGNIQGPDGSSFTDRAISDMEARVMTTLKNNLDPVTPFSFLDYFVQQMSERSLLNQAKNAVMRCMKDIVVVQYRPSCFAAAAVLMTSTDEALTSDLIKTKLRMLICCRIDTDPVFECYTAMKDMLG